jgi:polysaccharide export outer membrane protein
LQPARAQEERDYVLGSEDVVLVEVWQRPELSTQAIIDFNGNVTLPAVGQVKLAGRTPEDASEELTRRFRLVDRNIAEVLVRVVQYNSRKLFMMGEVVKPGRYSFAQVPSVWEAIQIAGGTTAMGSLRKVKVIRGAGESRDTFDVDVQAALDSGDLSSLEILRPGDTVLVPRIETIAV